MRPIHSPTLTPVEDNRASYLWDGRCSGNCGRSIDPSKTWRLTHAACFYDGPDSRLGLSFLSTGCREPAMAGTDAFGIASAEDTKAADQARLPAEPQLCDDKNGLEPLCCISPESDHFSTHTKSRTSGFSHYILQQPEDKHSLADKDINTSDDKGQLRGSSGTHHKPLLQAYQTDNWYMEQEDRFGDDDSLDIGVQSDEYWFDGQDQTQDDSSVGNWTRIDAIPHDSHATPIANDIDDLIEEKLDTNALLQQNRLLSGNDADDYTTIPTSVPKRGVADRLIPDATLSQPELEQSRGQGRSRKRKRPRGRSSRTSYQRRWQQNRAESRILDLLSEF